MSLPGLRVAVRAADAVRRRALVAMIERADHVVADDAPDVVLCDLAPGTVPVGEAEAPVLALADSMPVEPVAGVVPRASPAAQLDAALRAVAAGLIVRAPGLEPLIGFHVAEEVPALTPREVEILTLVGQGLTNKAIARRLGISVHTVKFHLEALFLKLEASGRAEAVAKGLRGGVIEL
jgi:two-component system, NarL family, nitrate/nitrite response regulator NarL